LNKRERAAVGYWLVRPLVSLIEIALLVPLLGIPLTVAAGLVAGWSGWVFPVSDVVAGLPASVAQFWPVIGALGLLAWLRLAVAPAIRGLGAAESRLAGSLLGGREALLEERVDALTASRLLVVDAAERERQRIERDLHDGAQQRLVAMTILLGRAQARLGDRDPEVADLIAQAKAESRSATAELRDLTRGLHPPVLTDRGLDAALSAVAARSPVPVDVVVDLPVRPPPGAEATIYFAIVEALTNVAKHSGAGRASVAIRRAGGIVVSTITDDGHGGADASKGTGLQGIMDRLSGVDGSLTVVSPPGGPTVLTIEVPGGG
jgi:signal transduction histidine kinase